VYRIVGALININTHGDSHGIRYTALMVLRPLMSYQHISIPAYQHISISAYQHISIAVYQHISIPYEPMPMPPGACRYSPPPYPDR
jgi:hypothetical protein